MRVGEQHGAARHTSACERAVRRALDARPLAGERALKEAEAQLEAQHACRGLAHRTLGYAPARDEARQLRAEKARDHVNVRTCEKALRGRVSSVCRGAVVARLGHGVPIGHDEPVEAPPLAQHAREQRAVRAGGQAIDRVKGRHHARTARERRGVEGREVHVLERRARDLGRVVVAPALRRRVTRKVLGARRDRVGRGEVGRLEAMHGRHAERAGEVRALAVALCDAAPPRVATHVEHRRERPANPVRARLDGRRAARGLDELRIP